MNTSVSSIIANQTKKRAAPTSDATLKWRKKEPFTMGSIDTQIDQSQPQYKDCIKNLDTQLSPKLILDERAAIEAGLAEGRVDDLLKVHTTVPFKAPASKAIIKAVAELNARDGTVSWHAIKSEMEAQGADAKTVEWFARLNLHAPLIEEKTFSYCVKNYLDHYDFSESEPKTLFEKLQARKFDPNNLSPEKEPLLKLNGIPVLYAGNVLTLVGHDKSGKSHLEAAIAKAITEPGTRHLGFSSDVSEGRAAYLDLEQDRSDFESLIIRKGIDPKKVAAYHLAGSSPKEARAALLAIIQGEENLVAVLIDGFADLLGSVNDDEEATELVANLMKIADLYQVAVIGVLHLNPGSDEKSRGHLGSQLGRKSQTVLQVKNLPDGSRVVFTQRARKRPIPEGQGVRFAWDEGLHTFAEVNGTPAEIKQAQKIEEWTRTLQSVQAETDMLAWKYNDLVKAIQSAEGVKSPTTAKTRIKDWLNAGLLNFDSTRGTYISTLSGSTSQNDQN
jgi:hypothetical protein